MYIFQSAYPSLEHEQAANRVVDIFSHLPEVQAVLLTCSCARGKASRDSCLDIAVLVAPDLPSARLHDLEVTWEARNQADPVFQALRSIGKYSQVDLEIVDGKFDAGGHNWTSGPDPFELAVGNLLAYSVPLWEHGGYLGSLKRQWLPYYGAELQQERLAMVHRYCLNNLHHIPGYIARGLYFQSFHRLWHAFGEFLQVLFISRRIYPIAYDKWVREQIEEILELPALYLELPKIFEIQRFESDEIEHKARDLESLLLKFVPAPEET